MFLIVLRKKVSNNMLLGKFDSLEGFSMAQVSGNRVCQISVSAAASFVIVLQQGGSKSQQVAAKPA